MLEQIESLDRSIFLALNSYHTPFLDVLMWLFSSIIPWIPLFLFIFYYAYKKGKIKLVIFILLGMAFCVLLADRISVLAFKEVFLRYRPTHNLEIRDLVKTVHNPFNGGEYRGGQYGFVSSHAANFFALATFLFLSFKSYSKKWNLLFLWAGIIAYSRIYLGVHYPLDIIGGGLLGLLIGYIVYLSLNTINHART